MDDPYEMPKNEEVAQKLARFCHDRPDRKLMLDDALFGVLAARVAERWKTDEEFRKDLGNNLHEEALILRMIERISSNAK